MSKQQQRDLDAMLRKAPLDPAGDVATLRAGFEGLTRQIPVAPDVRKTATVVGGIGAVEVSIDGTDPADFSSKGWTRAGSRLPTRRRSTPS